MDVLSDILLRRSWSWRRGPVGARQLSEAQPWPTPAQGQGLVATFPVGLGVRWPCAGPSPSNKAPVQATLRRVGGPVRLTGPSGDSLLAQCSAVGTTGAPCVPWGLPQAAPNLGRSPPPNPGAAWGRPASRPPRGVRACC